MALCRSAPLPLKSWATWLVVSPPAPPAWSIDCCRVSKNLPPSAAPAGAGSMSAGRMRIDGIELLMAEPRIHVHDFMFMTDSFTVAPLSHVVARCRTLRPHADLLTQQVEGLRNHVFRRLHGRRVQFVSPDRSEKIRHFLNRIDLGIGHVALRVCVGMPGLEAHYRWTLIGDHGGHAHSGRTFAFEASREREG